ncbi:MAG TPA: twin-arginine translocation signal domain-containing protein [Telluria sp.]|nr:twin-arginine translocation signal domain-containing protein [Telluria sp.]
MKLKKVDGNRRGFLRAAGGAGVLGTLAAAGVTPAQAAPLPQPEVAPVKTQSGYHETDHIRTYYATARYW